jgi:hypothetical protein
MALQNGTRGAAIAKGGYRPAPFKNTGTDKLVVIVPHRIYDRVKEISDREHAQMSTMACHAITEYFRMLDGDAGEGEGAEKI